MKIKDILKITWFPVLISSLCCVAPLALVLLGISTASFAASLSDTFYFGYRWMFRSAGLIALGISIWIYLKSKGICTLDQARKQRNKIINIIITVLITGILFYLIWLYIIIEYIGKLVGIWN